MLSVTFLTAVVALFILLVLLLALKVLSLNFRVKDLEIMRLGQKERIDRLVAEVHELQKKVG